MKSQKSGVIVGIGGGCWYVEEDEKAFTKSWLLLCKNMKCYHGNRRGVLVRGGARSRGCSAPRGRMGAAGALLKSRASPRAGRPPVIGR